MTDTTTTPVNVPTSWAAFIVSAQTHKTKIIAIIICVATALIGCTVFVNNYIELKAQLRERDAIIGTNSEAMRKVGNALVAQGNVVSDTKEIQKQAVAAMDQKLIDYMAANKATIRAIYTAIGQVAQEVKPGTDVNVNAGKDGSFKDVTLVETRTGPALAEVNLDWDPSAGDSTKRLSSKWTTYREDFVPSLGEWQKKDKGFVAAFMLHRDVYKEDPAAPGGFTKVGTENIDLKSATASYNRDIFATAAGVTEVPRWSAMIGAGRDFDMNKYVPVGILGYRLNNYLGVHAGAVGNTAILGGSYNFSFGN